MPIIHTYIMTRILFVVATCVLCSQIVRGILKNCTLYSPLTLHYVCIKVEDSFGRSTTDGMRWIQNSLDHTIRCLSAKGTRLSALASIEGICVTFIPTDPVIQTRWDCTDRVRIRLFLPTITPNWNDDVIVGESCCSVWAWKAPAFLRDFSFAISSSSSQSNAAGTRSSSKSCDSETEKLHGHP